MNAALSSPWTATSVESRRHVSRLEHILEARPQRLYIHSKYHGGLKGYGNQVIGVFG